MSDEIPAGSLEAAASILAKPEKFDARAHLRGASHATGKVAVYTDGAAAYRIEELQTAILDAQAHADALENNGSIAPDEGHDEALAKVAALVEQQEEAVLEAIRSRTTFHLRGVPMKLVRLLDKKARKEYPAPSRKNFAKGEEGEEAYELATFEQNLDRNEFVNHQLVASAIVKVEDFDGNVDDTVWSVDEVEDLAGNLYPAEWRKIVDEANRLSFAQEIFASTVERDADFLSKR